MTATTETTVQFVVEKHPPHRLSPDDYSEYFPYCAWVYYPAVGKCREGKNKFLVTPESTSDVARLIGGNPYSERVVCECMGRIIE